jgi:hypothetical protein
MDRSFIVRDDGIVICMYPLVFVDVFTCKKELLLYPGVKKSAPLFNFFINGDKIIIFRDCLYDQRKKFLAYTNFCRIPPKSGSLGVN